MSLHPPHEDYELLDFGQGRKLERFGAWVLDRPSEPAIGGRPRRPELWKSADARFEASPPRGRWSPDVAGRTWTISFAGLRFEVKPTPFGHVGLFPEHAAVWSALAERCRSRAAPTRVLNLFAYTGGATLAAAAAGAQVTHVDAADNVVRWARRNAELSGLADRPVRWIVDDAGKFVEREARRARRYDIVLLDPPAFGHGPQGERWSIDQDIEPLLADCRQLLESGGWLALSNHSRGYDLPRLVELAANCTGSPATGADLVIKTSEGRSLPSGAVAWSSMR